MAKKSARSKTKAKAKAKSKSKAKIKTKRKAAPKPRAKKSIKKVVAKKKSKAKPKSVKTAKPVVAPMPTMPAVQALPDIEVATTSGGRVRLSDLKGKNVVLYFYPKDDTPGCTAESCDIRDRFPQFQNSDTVVYGVSRDNVDSHEKFKSKFSFPFELISDPDEILCRAFDVIRKKSLYGREYMGIDRSTFIFDKQGQLRKEFRSVQVAGHADEILNEINKL